MNALSAVLYGTGVWIISSVMVIFLGLQLTRAAEIDKITNNNITNITGSGDTVWIMTSSPYTGWGYNYSIDTGRTWHGNLTSFDGHTPQNGMVQVAFGAGYAVIPLNDGMQFDQGTVWYYSIRDKKETIVKTNWPSTALSDTNNDLRLAGITFTNGKFYIASIEGGVISFDPAAGTMRAYQIGGNVSYALSQYTPQGDSSRRIYGISSFTDDSGKGVVLVTTPARVWEFHPSDSSWDSLSASFDRTGMAFEQAATDPAGKTIFAYAIHTASDSVGMFRFSFSQQKWISAVQAAPGSFSFAGSRYLYMVRDSNAIQLCSIPGDSTGAVLSVVKDSSDFNKRFSNSNTGIPARINDIFYIPLTDSTGNLWIASSNGIFFSQTENPAVTTAPFVYMRYVEKVGGGLKRAYALPGILTFEQNVRFMYKLSKDAKVTIRVFDFNMDLVKTVISNEVRKAGSAGSMNDNRDIWDGTNRFGRIVAPGVYYFKISTDKGEHGFGKIIVARQ
jgi:hypothetical protein